MNVLALTNKSFLQLQVFQLYLYIIVGSGNSKKTRGINQRI